MPASTVIQLRRDTAANWSTNNPILAKGEMGFEYDTGLFKIGDGVTAWSGLSYGGLTGPAQTQVLESFGDGSDGNVSLSSGVTTLVRDMFYNNLTLSGTAQIKTAGYKIFVSGILDITAAQVGAIINSGGNGANATTQTGGAVGLATVSITVGAGAIGTAGATGVVGAGVQASAANAGQNGGSSNISGGSGAGGPNAAGTAGALGRAGTVVVNPFPVRRYETNLLRGVTLIVAGSGGPGGSAGSGDGTTVANSCGGGGGGAGGGIVAIWANTINRDASTPASCIQVLGGNGGNGRSGAAAAASAGVGGGGGGSGAAGGWIFIQYNSLTGTTGTNCLDASGGSGGNGGNGFNGVGGTTAAGGTGGSGGNGGRITLLNVKTSVGSDTLVGAGGTGNANTGITGGTGGASGSNQVSL
jgi:hypothetical protein